MLQDRIRSLVGARAAKLLCLAMASFCVLAAMPAFASAYLTGVSLTTEGPSRIASLSLSDRYESGPVPAELSSIEFPVAATDTQLVGLAYRPHTDDLYAMAKGGTLYVIEGTPYKAVQVNQTPAVSPLHGNAFSLTFDPVKDAIRVIDDAEQSLLFSPINGEVLEETTLSLPSYEPVQPAPTGIAFGRVSSTPYLTYRAYVLESATDALDVLGSWLGPEPGVGGSLGRLEPLGLDITAVGGFASPPEAAPREAWAIVQPNGGGPQKRCRVEAEILQANGPQLGCGRDIAAEQPLTGLAIRPPAVLSLAGPVQGEEGETVDVPVERHGALDRFVTVKYGPWGPTLHPSPGRFNGPSGQLVFAPGETEKTIAVPIPKADGYQSPRYADLVLMDIGPDTWINGGGAVKVIGNAPHPTLVRPRLKLGEVLRKRRLVVRYRCKGPCRVEQMTLSLAGVELATLSSSAFSSGPSTAVFELGPKARQAIRAHAGRRGLWLRLQATFGPEGEEIVRSMRIHLARKR